MLSQGHLRSAPGRLTRGILCFVLVALLALLPAEDLAPALKEIAKWFEFVLIYWLIASDITRLELDGLIAALLLAGILEAALGIYQFAFGIGPEGFALFGRYMRGPMAPLPQPNPLWRLSRLAAATGVYHCHHALAGGGGRTATSPYRPGACYGCGPCWRVW